MKRAKTYIKLSGPKSKRIEMNTGNSPSKIRTSMSCDDHPVLKSVLTYTTGLTYAVYPLLTRVYDCGKPVSIYQPESKYVYPLFERVYYCGKPVLIFEPVSTHGGTAKTSHSISSTSQKTYKL